MRTLEESFRCQREGLQILFDECTWGHIAGVTTQKHTEESVLLQTLSLVFRSDASGVESCVTSNIQFRAGTRIIGSAESGLVEKAS